MREYCEHKGLWIDSLVPYSPSSNGVAERQQHARSISARFKPPAALQGRGDDNLHVPAQQDANEGVTIYGRFYGMKPDVENIRTCLARR